MRLIEKLWKPIMTACVVLALSVNCFAIDYDAIAQIESSGNAYAVSKKQCFGMYQISDICRRDFNICTKSNITKQELFNAKINKKICRWYFEERLPELLACYSIPCTDENKIIAYNAGIETAINHYRYGKQLPKETKLYLKKYFKKGVSK